MKLAEQQYPEVKNPGEGLRKIRRRRLYLWGIILVYLPAMYAAIFLTDSYKIIGTVFLAWVVLLTFFATMAASARCPRCGNYFHMHGMTLLYLRKCLHCQLHINADKKNG